MGDGFYRSKDPTNSIKVLKEATKENNTKNKENTRTLFYSTVHAAMEAVLRGHTSYHETRSVRSQKLKTYQTSAEATSPNKRIIASFSLHIFIPDNKDDTTATCIQADRLQIVYTSLAKATSPIGYKQIQLMLTTVLCDWKWSQPMKSVIRCKCDITDTNPWVKFSMVNDTLIVRMRSPKKCFTWQNE